MKNTWIVRDEDIRARAMVCIAQLDITRPWSVEIKPYRKKRSLSQNALYWVEIGKIVEAIAEHTGYDRDEVHDFLKRKFLTPTVIEIGGEVCERYTTTKLSTQEMSDYMERCRAWAVSELGLLIPVQLAA